MLWNIDYEVASIVFQFVFITFYLIKKHLPTRQNRLYIATTLCSFCVVCLDVFTAVINSYARDIPMPFLQIANLLFFVLVPVLSFLFFMYILTVTNQFNLVGTPLFVVLCMPAVVSALLAVSSPFTGLLYYFDRNMVYTQGSCYLIEFIANAFYIILTVAFAIAYKEKIKRIERNSIFLFCILLILGVVLQSVWFRWILLTNAVTGTALIIIYLSLQNPDAYIDKSSGMFNLDAFVEMSQEYINRGNAFSLVYFKIEDYRDLDALYGSENVAVAMNGVTDYLTAVFARRGAYRMDVSSFVIQELDTGDFKEIEEALLSRFSKPFRGATEDVYLNIGVVTIPYWHVPQNISDILALLSFGERMKDMQKALQVIEVDDTIINKMDHERAVDRAIENAIANESIQIYFQPIYSTETGKISSCEALARLFDDEIGFIPPDEFIEKAEKNGSIVKLGLQIYEKVCRFLKEQEPERFGLESVHVNLSPVQCKQENLATELINIANKYGIDRERLDLEITESAATGESKDIRKNMDKLIAASFSFSLDDYGTGYSNTSTIIQLPFKAVKIDKSLLWAYYDHKSNILPDLVKMFHNQRLEIIVEGVETEEMVKGLTEMRCENLQGYYFAKPLPPREFVAYIGEFNRK